LFIPDCDREALIMTNIFTYKNYTLGFKTFSASPGIPLIHFHVRGGSRLEGHFFDRAAKEKGITLFCLERPGYGKSDFFRWTLQEWADIVECFANQHNLRKFAVSGISGGAVHALACAYYIPSRLTSCEVISTIGPAESDFSDFPGSMKFAMWSSTWFPLLYRIQLLLERHFYANPDKLRRIIEKNKDAMNPHEYSVYDNHELLTIYANVMREGMSRGVGPMIYELALFNKSWGFSLKDLTFPVTIWQGEEDFAFAQVKRMVNILPNPKAHFMANQGHLSVPLLNIEEILTDVVHGHERRKDG
jgi:pimeloyl-ACP methyl ester carboxylesterase